MSLPSDHLFWSYRLAKFEVASERRGIGRVGFARYEQTLPARLERLAQMTRSPAQLFRDVDPGRVWIRPKAIAVPARGGVDDGSFISVPERLDDHGIAAMSVRVMLEPAPDFATSEVVWLRAFGPALECQLGREILGNRLDLRGQPPSIRPEGRRAFRYWLPDYKRFTRSGPAFARALLIRSGSPCHLISLDLADFYDNIDPAFLVLPDFLEEVHEKAGKSGLSLDRSAYIEATTGLLEAFQRFRVATSGVLGVSPSRGIPIGSLAARLIANLALVELDRHVLSQPSVRHYARYVDDIVIVEQTHPDAKPGMEAVRALLPLDGSRTSPELFVLDERRLRRPGSNLSVQHSKLRVFRLEGDDGIEYLRTVEADMERISSERRRFLEPRTQELDQIVGAAPNAEPIRALREAHALSLRRAAIGTVSDKVTTAAAMLSREEASAFSRQHLGMAGRLATAWSRWVDLFDVSMRILSAVLVAGDGETATEIIEAIESHAASLADGRGRSFRVRWGASRIHLRRARKLVAEWVRAQLVETICGTAPFANEGFTVKKLRVGEQGLGAGKHLVRPDELLEIAQLLSAADLRAVDRETDHCIGTLIGHRQNETVASLQQQLGNDTLMAGRVAGLSLFLDACREQADRIYSGFHGVDLLLAFRPPTYTDILFRWVTAGRSLEELLGVVNAVRGTRYIRLPMNEVEDEGGTLIEIEPPRPLGFAPVFTVGTTRLVLGNLCTEKGWWEESLRGSPVLTRERQRRLARVLNQAMDEARRAKKRGSPTMLVLPELSLPRQWVREVCAHLTSNEPSLSMVAGLEYDVQGSAVYNEAIAFLPRSHSSGAAWVWTKRRPAHAERQELASSKHGKFIFASRNEHRRFAVLSSEHGRFIPLICSELLEVDTRAELLGRVELVLVPAWNRDTTSFEYFVHASTLELHSFVAVANNGLYSDCRIRGPYTDAWLRDVSRLIVRDENETVVADLPIDRMLEYRSDPKGYDDQKKSLGFKPVPPGMGGPGSLTP